MQHRRQPRPRGWARGAPPCARAPSAGAPGCACTAPTTTSGRELKNPVRRLRAPPDGRRPQCGPGHRRHGGFLRQPRAGCPSTTRRAAELRGSWPSSSAPTTPITAGTASISFLGHGRGPPRELRMGRLTHRSRARRLSASPTPPTGGVLLDAFVTRARSSSSLVTRTAKVVDPLGRPALVTSCDILAANRPRAPAQAPRPRARPTSKSAPASAPPSTLPSASPVRPRPSS